MERSRCWQSAPAEVLARLVLVGPKQLLELMVLENPEGAASRVEKASKQQTWDRSSAASGTHIYPQKGSHKDL